MGKNHASQYANFGSLQMANELPGVKSEIVEKGRVYHLIACHIYILKSYPNLQSDADHGN